MFDIDHLFEIGFGPHLMPLSGKVPAVEGWRDYSLTTREQLQDWIASGFNLGLRTGDRSGIFVVDVDAYHPDCAGYSDDSAPLASTANGGYHFIYRAPIPCLRNTTSGLGAHVDTRGEGGYIVIPGSELPEGQYSWIRRPNGPLPELPAEVIEELTKKTVHVPAPAPEIPRQGYGQSALVKEAARVRVAPEGTRNDTLNRATFNVGQLVGGGELTAAEVYDAMLDAAETAGLGTKEADKTIHSALSAGIENPRQRPVKRRNPAPKAEAPAPDMQYIAVPGRHTDLTGCEQIVGSNDFCKQVLEALPEGSIYLRAGVVGEIGTTGFKPIESFRIRSIIDKHAQLGQCKVVGNGAPRWYYKPAGADHGGLVIAYAQAEGGIRKLEHLAHHPVYISDARGNISPAKPGWNEDSGTFLTEGVPDPLPLAESKAVLEDLLCDFPFATTADMENYLGLMLSPILRPAIGEPVPLHLINSPIERTGKTKLAEIVLGCGVLGRPTPATQLGTREEEREKRITSLLLAGETIVHLDNLSERCDSAALASLLTATTFQGRLLGSSVMASITNSLVMVGTGNNVHATGEIAKRTVPILLLPKSDSPENRTDYKHPQIKQFVQDNRPRILASLLGLVENWRAKGCPSGAVPFGGFERWTALVGGILSAAGYRCHLENLKTWRGEADDFSEEVRLFVKGWCDRFGTERIPTTKLYDLAAEMQILQSSKKSDLQRRGDFGRTLSKLANRFVGGFHLTFSGKGGARVGQLKRQAD